MNHACSLLASVSLALLAPSSAIAQLPSCDGDDPEGAGASFEEGNRLMSEAIDQAGRRHIEQARELAAEALSHFDRQCELGDESALAERGAALMLMGEALASSQSYDAYLAAHPIESLPARTRRRIEANLQPGSVGIELEGEATGPLRLFVDDLDFGVLPRERAVRLPLGDHALEARDEAGEVLASTSVSLTTDNSELSARLTLPTVEAVVVPVPIPVPHPEPAPTPVSPSERVDFMPYYIITGLAAGVFLGTAIGLQVAADDRAQTFNRFCRDPSMPFAGCDSVRSEYDGFFGAAIAGYVLAGLAAAGLGAVIGLDMTQPRPPMRITLSPARDGAVLGLAGSF